MDHFEQFKRRQQEWDRRAATVKRGRGGVPDPPEPTPEELRRIVRILAAAQSRCTNPKVPNYPNYGGRGILFSDAFVGLAGAKRFIAEIGLPPMEPTRSTIKARIDTLERFRELGMLDTPGQREAVLRLLLDGDYSGFGVKP